MIKGGRVPLANTGRSLRAIRRGSFFVVGDIHGCAGELRELLRSLPLRTDSLILFVGDYVDRGPESRDVVETIIDLSNRYAVETLMGNHEAMLLDYLENPHSAKAGMFIYNGGSATLASYADKSGQYEIPDRHMAFFRSLKLYYETENYFCVHAGVPEMPLEEMNPELYRDELLWSRKTVNSDYMWSKLIVHGHTVRPEVEVKPNRINVDTGCVYDRRLSAIQLPEKKIFSVRRRQRAGPVYLRDHKSRRQAVRFTGSVPVYVEGHDIHGETINYSEIGMYFRCVSSPPGVVLQSRAEIHGMVGQRDSPSLALFRGEVVRADHRPDALYYAIKITHTESAYED